MHAFSDLALAVYCPRKLYYRREDAREVPDAVATRRALAFEYRTLLDADASLLRTRPIAVAPDEFRTNLARTRDRLDRFEELAWERGTPVETAFVEYPTYGIVRRIELTTRRKALYRRAVRTVEAIDGPPPRLTDDAKCATCEYRDRCGVRTRSLRSLLGL